MLLFGGIVFINKYAMDEASFLHLCDDMIQQEVGHSPI
jgi:hypothetical protein